MISRGDRPYRCRSWSILWNIDWRCIFYDCDNGGNYHHHTGLAKDLLRKRRCEFYEYGICANSSPKIIYLELCVVVWLTDYEQCVPVCSAQSGSNSGIINSDETRLKVDKKNLRSSPKVYLSSNYGKKQWGKYQANLSNKILNFIKDLCRRECHPDSERSNNWG